MRRFVLAAIFVATAAMAQNVSQFKVVDDSLLQGNSTYVTGNKYQRDALLFVDMLADTHPYYIKKERREKLFAGEEYLMAKCAECNSDSAFVELLIATLGNLHDKHTDVIDLGRLERKRNVSQEAASVPQESADAVMAYKGDVFHYVIIPEHNLCYLQFNQCVDARTMRNDSLPRWDLMLDEMFSKMKAEGIKHLVVDAQYNNGGSSMLCDELLVRLCSLEHLQQFSTSLRFSRLMAAYNPRITVAKQHWEADGHVDELYPMPEGKVDANFVQPEVFDGKVVFVQSEKTYSSAGILMTLVRDNHLGAIVGTQSSFSPSHYGEVLPYRLPNTGVVGTVSCKFFARPDRECVEETSLSPDVHIDLSDKERAFREIVNLFER